MTEKRIFDITEKIKVGKNQPLLILAGPCVLEEKSLCLDIAETMKDICSNLGMNYVFKASFDKANRTSVNSFRGPGLEKGVEELFAIKEAANVPIVTDLHEASQAKKVAEVADILQIPAFLCRQTDLLLAAGNTGKTVNIKKGQFLAPGDMSPVVEKIRTTGNDKIMLTERGTTFGYNNLVVDMRSFNIMAETGCPIVFDATHSVQLPGGQGSKSGGQPEFIAPLSKAAVAVGIDVLFLEVHPTPEKALSDGANSLKLDDVENLLKSLARIRSESL